MFGAEGNGLRDSTIEACDYTVVTDLPMSRKTPVDDALRFGFAPLQNRRSHAITWGYVAPILAKP